MIMPLQYWILIAPSLPLLVMAYSRFKISICTYVPVCLELVYTNILALDSTSTRHTDTTYIGIGLISNWYMPFVPCSMDQFKKSWAYYTNLKNLELTSTKLVNIFTQEGERRFCKAIYNCKSRKLCVSSIVNIDIFAASPISLMSLLVDVDYHVEHCVDGP